MRLSETEKSAIVDSISESDPSAKIYLFGSRATSQHAKHSDIDVAIDAKNKLPRAILGKIKDEIEESTIPLFVDIVDFNNAPEDLKNQIIKYGKI